MGVPMMPRPTKPNVDMCLLRFPRMPPGGAHPSCDEGERGAGARTQRYLSRRASVAARKAPRSEPTATMPTP